MGGSLILYCADGRGWFVGFVFVFLRVPCQFGDFMLRIVPGFNSTLFVPLPAPCHGSAFPSVLAWLVHPKFHYPRRVPKMRPAHFGPEDPPLLQIDATERFNALRQEDLVH